MEQLCVTEAEMWFVKTEQYWRSLLQGILSWLFNEGLNDKTITVDKIGLRKTLKAFIWKMVL